MEERERDGLPPEEVKDEEEEKKEKAVDAIERRIRIRIRITADLAWQSGKLARYNNVSVHPRYGACQRAKRVKCQCVYLFSGTGATGIIIVKPNTSDPYPSFSQDSNPARANAWMIYRGLLAFCL